MKIYKNLDINNLDGEVWKVIEDFPDYQVSNLGRIKSFKRYKEGKILIQRKNRHEYLSIDLWKNRNKITKRVHRLQLLTFKPIDNSNIFQVNHIDGNKENNLLENLEWCTASENDKHAYRIGLKKSNHKSINIGEKHPLNKLKNGEVWLIKKILNSDYYKSGKINQTFIGKMFEVSHQVISKIKLEKLWSHIKYEEI